MFTRLQAEGRSLIKGVVGLVYFMRGSVSYTEIMNMSYGEREIIHEFIEERFEQEKKSPYPVY